MFQGRVKGVSRRFEECFKEVSMVFPECFKGVLRNIEEYFKEEQGIGKKFKGKFQMCMKGSCFKGFSRKFSGCFTVVSRD